MRLTEIPDSLTALKDLTRLSMCDNSIKHIPMSIAKLTNLTELELDHNGVSALLPELHVLTKLVWLNVYSNPIKTPPFEIIRLILPSQKAMQNANARPGFKSIRCVLHLGRHLLTLLCALV
jgi:Leucine-rich repeat (LRR) protein